jgi:hypothetical protein
MEQLVTVWAGGRDALARSGAVLVDGCRFGDIGPLCEAYFGGPSASGGGRHDGDGRPIRPGYLSAMSRDNVPGQA